MTEYLYIKNVLYVYATHLCGNKTLTYPCPNSHPQPFNHPTCSSPLSYPSQLQPMPENNTKFDTPLQVTVSYFSVRTAGLP